MPRPRFLEGLFSTGIREQHQRIFTLGRCQPAPPHCFCIWSRWGGQGTLILHEITCLGDRGFSISASAPCWHLSTLHRPGGAVGAQGRSAQADTALPGSFLLLHPNSCAKSRCPGCRDAINHYGDCSNPQAGLRGSAERSAPGAGQLLERSFFPCWCAVPEGKGRFVPPCQQWVCRWNSLRQKSPYDMDQVPVTGVSRGSFVRGMVGFGVLKGLSPFMLMKGFNLMENPALCVKPWLRESIKGREVSGNHMSAGPGRGMGPCRAHVTSGSHGRAPSLDQRPDSHSSPDCDPSMSGGAPLRSSTSSPPLE